MRHLSALSAVILLVLGALACGPSPGAAEQTAGTPPAADAAEAAAAVGGPTAAVEPELPEPDLGYGARQGRVIFQHYCATCHGTEGHGDGFNAFNLDPKPRDLADPAFQAERSDEDLAAVIRTGGGATGLSTGMPPWGRTLSARQVQDLILYLRTLRPEAE
jgi:mono/diheme cytochrome c family protein